MASNRVDLGPRVRWHSTAILLIGLLALAGSAMTLRGLVTHDPRLSTASTVFAAVLVQAVPFLALGVVVSGLVATFVSPEWLAHERPRRTGLRSWRPDSGERPCPVASADRCPSRDGSSVTAPWGRQR